jgi:hypothetical protein
VGKSISMDKPTCDFCHSPGDFGHQAGTCTGCINAIQHLRKHGFLVDQIQNGTWHIAYPTPRFNTNGLSVTTYSYTPGQIEPTSSTTDFNSLEELLDHITTTSNTGGTIAK